MVFFSFKYDRMGTDTTATQLTTATDIIRICIVDDRLTEAPAAVVAEAVGVVIPTDHRTTVSAATTRMATTSNFQLKTITNRI